MAEMYIIDYLLRLATPLLGGACAGGVAWGGVRWEQRSMRRAMRRHEKATKFILHTIIILSQSHNENHQAPESVRIDLSELSQILGDVPGDG
jgi:hypothetical protein